MKFHVVTLNHEKFNQACIELRNKVEQSGYIPDVIVAIPRAGKWMTDAAWTDCDVSSVSLIRKPKGNLKRHVGMFIKHLPLALRDRLRIWEAKRLVKRNKHMSATIIELPILHNTVKRILLVDDAVDSGATLNAVTEEFNRQYPEIEVRSAVITITSEDPMLLPDYYLFNNLTLIRSPWSIDMR